MAKVNGTGKEQSRERQERTGSGKPGEREPRAQTGAVRGDQCCRELKEGPRDSARRSLAT